MTKCELTWLRGWGCVGLILSAVGQAELSWRESSPIFSSPPQASLVLLKPDAWQPESHLPSLQSKNYKAVCLELKPEPIKVRSFFDAIPAARPETPGEVTWSQGSFADLGGQDLSQVLADTREREREHSAVIEQSRCINK